MVVPVVTLARGFVIVVLGRGGGASDHIVWVIGFARPVVVTVAAAIHPLHLGVFAPDPLLQSRQLR
ncbi:MAG: hypothetical protein NVSMB29_19990 [Candidatus Dormibacteria bacterium]